MTDMIETPPNFLARLAVVTPADDDICWHAVATREARADGRLIVAVKTTGIYCKPSCRSRQPKRGNVRFFATPIEARTAGFRACKRCRPDQPAGS